MRAFEYERLGGVGSRFSTGRGEADASVQFLAGGTTLVDLMKLDVLRPTRVVDINQLADRYSAIEADADGLTLGAMAKMADAAEHPAVLADYPVIAQSLQLAASQQLRNMATLGGNVLQRTRCPYYRDPTWDACNKRRPGSGCAAIAGPNRNHAVLGIDDSCIAQYPGDFGVALAALDAAVTLTGPGGERRIPFTALHRPADGEPQIETTLEPGEIITSFHIPAGAWTRRSLYLKIRDRASYEFAIASAAVALVLEGEVVREARIGLGGMAYLPWRATAAEAALLGRTLDATHAGRAAEIALTGAKTHGENDYKPELGRRTLVRALLAAKAMEV